MLIVVMDPAIHREDIDPRKSRMDILQPDQVALVFHGLVPRRGYHFPVRKGDDPDIVVDLALMAGQGIDIEFSLRMVDIEIPDLTVEPDMMDLRVILEVLVGRPDRHVTLMAQVPDVRVEMVPVVVGIIVGYIVALCMGLVDLSGVATASWFALPPSISHFQLPQFAWEPFVFMIPVAIAPVIEHIGDVYVVSAVAEKDFVKDPGLHRTMLGDGLACLFASFVGGPPVTTYSEVTGAMQITRVTHPQVIRIAAGTAVVFSVIGKLSALLQSIPSAVLGGIMLLLFGSIASVGIQYLIHHKVDFSETRNIIIASVTLTMGIGGAIISFGTFSMSGIGLSALTGVLLNLLLPQTKPEK